MIDLRSDTVTKPSQAMRRLMSEAHVGDDVYGEDPTVNRLETLATEMTGMDEALFVPSGTQANLLALLSHCGRGEEYIVGQDAHNYKYEAGGAAMLGGIQPQPIDFEADGTLDLKKVKSFIKPNDSHFAQAKLLSLENTQAGKVLPLSYLKKAKEFAEKNSLSLHLDGARLLNATVASGLTLKDITQLFNSVSICLSKGLGAPVGSLLCGNSDILQRARRYRKAVGGGMRQAGILAAAAIYALENNIDRLEEDHQNARRLADGLSEINDIEIESAQTNMVFLRIKEDRAEKLTKYLKEKNILIQGRYAIRLVTHLDITADDIEKVIIEFKGFFKN